MLAGRNDGDPFRTEEKEDRHDKDRAEQNSGR
jgi:hypothetical protein